MAHAIFLLLLLQPLLSCALAATDIQSANPTIRDTQSPSTEAGEESLSQKLALSSLEPRNSSKPFALRTLPLGASITWGYKSPDGNGYREFLRNNMTSAGWEVNMVGSLRHGSMTDNVRLVVFSFSF
jgi:lysophospholipase L1-like esterase